MKIYYRKTIERKSFVEEILHIFEEEIRWKKRILVKPNIVSREEYPTTTHIETLDAVLSLLTKSDRELVVGDGPALDARPQSVIKYHIIKDICAKHNVKLLNLHKYPKKVFNTNSDGQLKLKISTIPLTCDYIISLPILKAHKLKNIGITCALKNQFGYLSNFHRLKYHIKHRLINRCIANINYTVRTDLFIVDGIEVLLNANEIRHGGYIAKLGIMFAGKDPVALDSYGFKLLKELGEKKLLNKDPVDIEYISLAQAYDLGNTNYELIEI
ncbi:MAG: DUF362 domain-containing protein [Spirochaetota bacterium]|nr:DUF362 domain-containing protein [Spirochaetota bacterium]